MNETLISACTMFLIPATLLFGALGVASSSFLKVLVCLLGVATTGIWLYRIWWWTSLSLIDRRTALGPNALEDPDLLMPPSSVAESYWLLYQQPKSAWTFELEIRPFGEKW